MYNKTSIGVDNCDQRKLACYVLMSTNVAEDQEAGAKAVIYYVTINQVSSKGTYE